MKHDPPLVELTLVGHRVVATSVAGVQTCLQLPAYDLCFDIGRCPISAVHQRTVLITHGHVDHLGGLVHHISLRAMWRMSPSRVVLPAEIFDDVTELLQVWRRIARTELPCELIPVAPGDRLDLGRGLTLVPVRASHRVPTLAYLVEHTRDRLRAELSGLTGPEIGARRRAGERVTEPHTTWEVAFTADTRAALFDRDPRFFAARLLLCECTFVDQPEEGVDHRDRADRTGHLRLHDLETRADAVGNEAILLTHFSTRSSVGSVRRAIAALPERLAERLHALPLVTPS